MRDNLDRAMTATLVIAGLAAIVGTLVVIVAQVVTAL
jgi:hypothetical protein